MNIDLRDYPLSLQNAHHVEDTQHFLMVFNSLMQNVVIDTELILKVGKDENILDWSVSLGMPIVSSEPLLETVIKHFVQGWTSGRSSKGYYHEGIFLASSKATALQLGKEVNGMFSGKILSLQPKAEWYKDTGLGKLENLLNKCELSKADKAKLHAFIRAEGIQFKALVGISMIIPWYVQRVKNNRVIDQQLNRCFPKFSAY